MDLCRRNAFPVQMRIGVLRGREEQLREGIRELPVDFLGHGAVKAAQACLHVGNRYSLLCRGQGTGQRRVDIPDHHDPIRALVLQERFEGQHHPRRLLAMAAGANPKRVQRARDLEFLEKHLRHARIVMLSGMHQKRGASAEFGQRGHERSNLDEVRPRASDHDDFAHGSDIHVGSIRIPGS